jgi:hypothetical protein
MPPFGVRQECVDFWVHVCYLYANWVIFPAEGPEMKKLTFIFLCVVTLSARTGLSDEPRDERLTSQVTAILKECSNLSVRGATRADLLKDFTTEGGIFWRGKRIYASRICPFIKIDVEFDVPIPSKSTTEVSTDKIKSISRPYLEYTISD